VDLQPHFSDLVRFSSFELNLGTGELRRQGVPLKLQPQPAKILTVLVKHAGQIVTRQELAREVWGLDTFVDFEQGLNFAIRQIRAALEDSADQPRFLETLPKRGYRFIAPIEVTTNASLHPIDPSTTSTAVGPPVVEKPRSLLSKWQSASLVVLLIFLTTGYVLISKRTLKASAGPIRSLVVLPLQNLSGDPTQEYLADGMTDELTTQLARISSIRVSSRTSAMHYKGSKTALPEIARELKVDAVVEGSIVRVGNRIRLTAQLIDASSDQHLWADSYEREMQDILSLQVEIARDVAEQIRAKLSPEDETRLAQRRTINPEAFEDYFKGRYFWNKRTEADFQKATAYFKEAIAKDPRYAEAYVGLADCYLSSASYSAMPPAEAGPLAKAAATKALEIDDSLAEAHSPLGIIKAEYDWDLPAAEREFEKAIRLNPNDGRAHQFYAEDVLEPEGRNEEANRELVLAEQADPSSIMTRAAAGFAFVLGRQYDRAILQEQKTIELDPNFPKAHQMLGLAYQQKAMYKKALSEFQIAISLDPNPAYVANLAQALALAGKKKEALATLHRLTQMSSGMYVHPYSVALVYLALGDHDQSLAWLERSRSERCWILIYLNVDPRLDPLRSDPRFQAFQRRVGLSPQLLAASRIVSN
jgi:TolB-like protein/DNA-binding winged helix-turn-helix (wHTH) protein/Tfp pilus assembly protein PilF